MLGVIDTTIGKYFRRCTKSLWCYAMSSGRTQAFAAAISSVVLLTPIAYADVSFQWQNNNTDEKEALLATYLADSNIITDFVSVVSENFKMEEPLSIIVGSSDGPSYDHESHAIKLPYSYLENAIRAQTELLEEGDVAVDRAIDVVEYTLYHLLGHALVRDSSIDSDEIAQQLSTWIMLQNWPNGGEQWLADVRAFAQASQKLDGNQQEFWHKHALLAARQQELECWILGFSPQLHEPMMPAVLKPEERRKRCVLAWHELEADALNILTPVLQAEAKLLPR